ncbi:hypothetical protein R6Q59_003560 [Mikania micrantha]
MESIAVQEFSRTLFNMRPDIALCTLRMIFQSDLRSLLGQVQVPCHIIHSCKDAAVPSTVTDYLQWNIGSKTIVWRSFRQKVTYPSLARRKPPYRSCFGTYTDIQV